jgi:antitoxin component YwqK of YwqJK toxin-antitoxin module
LWWSENYKNGKEDGLYELFHENGQLEFRQNYKNGKQDGLREYYYENGQLEFRQNYKNGKEDGLLESYYENGQLKQRGNYKDEERDGLWEDFYLKGQLLSFRTYKEGQIIISEHYDKNNQRITDGILEDYSNKQLRLRLKIKDGERSSYEIYFENGQLQQRGDYKDGEPDGLLEGYHYNGQLRWRVNYNNGKKDGISETYDKNGWEYNFSPQCYKEGKETKMSYCRKLQRRNKRRSLEIL